MTVPETLTSLQARRLALSAQGFGKPLRGSVKAHHLRDGVERLGVLQLDSVNALVRSHYLPLFSRLGDYPRETFDRLAWSSGRQRQWFEYWGHEASLLPITSYPLFRWRMRRAADGRGIYKELAQFGREQQSVIRQVLAMVEQRGALGAGEVARREAPAGGWWNWSAEKRALEWLFAAGEVTVAGRRGFERLYDLPERVLPRAVLDVPEPSEADAQRTLLLHAARSLGVATETDLRDYFRLAPRDARQRLLELVEEGALTPLRVAGWDRPGYCVGSPRILRRINASALLSPFDSLIWERARTERLFGFHYRLEFYTPAHRRLFGYYVLPFLHDERLVGRVDLRAERSHGVLAVHAVHAEHRGLDDVAFTALAQALQRLATWLGLGQVRVDCASGLAGQLRREMDRLSDGPA